MRCWIGAFALLAAVGVTLAADCRSKDKDYCSVDTSCIFDYSMGRCIDASCGDYTMHNTCLADEKKHGPCEWDWARNACFPKNGRVRCDLQFVDCDKEHCTFDENTGFCGEKGEPVPCTIHNTDECPTEDGCVTKDGVCLSTAEANACSSNYDADSCNSNKSPKCKWYPDQYLCFPKDLDIPCSNFYDKDSCPSDRCKAIQISEMEYVCLESSAPVTCELFFEETYCPDGDCQWNGGANRCYDPKIGLDCNEYLNIENCPSTKCRVVNNMCVDKEEPVDCSAIYYGDNSCNKDNGCRPDCDNKICIDCPESGSCDDSPCPDVKPDPEIECHKHITPADCPPQLCTWNHDTLICEAKESGVVCENHDNYDDCINEPTCTWDIDMCVSCEGRGNCDPVTTTTIPDSGKACSTYDENSCPYPRCTFRYTSSIGSCQKTSCLDLYNQGDCEKRADCKYSKDAMLCYDAGEGIPCSYFYEKSTCNQQDQCTWDSDSEICAGADTGKDCDQYSEANCPSRCVVDYDTESCRDPTCFDIFDAEKCKANSKCQYDTCAYTCFEDSGEKCNKYKSFNTCPPSRCAFRFPDSSGEGECVDKSCVDYCDETQCKAASCQFDPAIGCYKDDGKDCSKYSDYATCPQTRCTWYSETGQQGSFQCLDKVCSEYFDQATCKAGNCKWDGVNYVCYEDSNEPCTNYNARTCPMNRCVYDYDFYQCRTPGCSDIYDKKDCENSDKGCAYSEKFYVCYIKKEGIPCSVFSYEEQDCKSNSDRCKYNSDLSICYPKDGKIPCSQIFQKSQCAEFDYCQWSDFQQCRAKEQ